MDNLLWFVPSFYGDISLRGVDKKRTILVCEKLTQAEKVALRSLGQTAEQKGWTPTQEMFQSLPTREAPMEIELGAPLTKVRRVLFKLLQPDRIGIEVVKFSDGSVEESREHPYRSVKVDDLEAARRRADAAEAKKKKEEEARRKKEEAERKKAVAGATVSQPAVGCPMPEFAQAELKARRVLDVFLNKQQRADFDKHDQFITVGGGTGHRYMITSRHAVSRFAVTRQLHDLDEKRSYCVHDFTVPAAEELLALHLLVQIPRQEQYLRSLRE